MMYKLAKAQDNSLIQIETQADIDYLAKGCQVTLKTPPPPLPLPPYTPPSLITHILEDLLLSRGFVRFFLLP